jgi:hypothetical protein
MGGGGWIGIGFMILFWIAAVVGVVYLVRYLVARPGPTSGARARRNGESRVQRGRSREDLKPFVRLTIGAHEVRSIETSFCSAGMTCLGNLDKEPARAPLP